MKNRKKWYNEILAFAEGKIIQSKRPNMLDKWEDDNYPLWNDSDFHLWDIDLLVALSFHSGHTCIRSPDTEKASLTDC